MVWGKETMKCLGVFCVNQTKYQEVPNARPEAGLGFLSVVGIAACFSLVPTALIMLFRTFQLMRFSTSTTQLTSAVTVIAMGESRWVTLAAAVALFVLMSMWTFISFYIPNSWEFFTAERIAHNAALLVTNNAELCGAQWRVWTCTDLPWANFKTKNVTLSENLVLKLYPSNLFFFGYLLLLILTVPLIRVSRRGRLFLKRSALGYTYGEVLLAVVTVLMLGLFFSYWVHDHNYNGYWGGGSDPNITPSERWARSSGQLAAVLMGLLFFPASRASIVHRIFGTSWESFLWLHRVLGYGCLAAIVAHFVAWYVKYDQGGFFPRDIMDVPMTLPTSIDNFTVPISTLATWTLLFSMGLFALAPIRRRMFELFYYSHLVAVYVTIPAVLWHAAAGWEYLLPGVTVWFIDRMIRLNRSASIVKIVDVILHNGTVELRFLQPSMQADCGMYCFINIPEISLFQWHPFTLSSAAGSPFFSFHIKAMGEGTWTGKLLSLVANGDLNLTLAVDGPYGRPIDFADFECVVLIAGGIGITPCASLFSGLKGETGIVATLIWALREEDLLSVFSEHLSMPSTTAAINRVSGGSVTEKCSSSSSRTRVFLTSGREEQSTPTGIIGVDVLLGRPDLPREIVAAAQSFEPPNVLVFVCGVEAMVKTAHECAEAHGFNFHAETFFL
jgi:predicted ferric reductase